MITELITPPTVEPFSLTDLKTALRIDHSHEDDLVMRLGVTARAFIERRLGVAMATQTWRVTLSAAPCGPLSLRPGPVVSVDAVELIARDAPPVLTSDWKLSRGKPASLEIDAPWSALEEIRVTFTAGRSDVSMVEPELTEAILALTAHYYEHRSAVEEGRYVALPLRVESLLASFREVRL